MDRWVCNHLPILLHFPHFDYSLHRLWLWTFSRGLITSPITGFITSNMSIQIFVICVHYNLFTCNLDTMTSV